MTASSSTRNFARFIPSEELGTVSTWTFGRVGDPVLSQAETLELPAEMAPEEPVEAKLARAWDEGYTAGFAQGQSEATQEGNRRLDDFVQNQGVEAARHLAAMVVGLDGRLKQAEQDIAQQVLALACELARQVVRRELAADPLALLPVVREALGMLVTDGKPAVVKINAADLALLQEPLRSESLPPNIHFVADAAVTRGDCLVESAGTVIDGTVARRWERAVANLGVASVWQADETPELAGQQADTEANEE